MRQSAKVLVSFLFSALPIFASEDSHPSSTFTLAAGTAGFYSSQEKQWGNNSGLFGRAEYLHKLGIPIGASLSLGYDLCMVCDNTGGEYVASYSVVAQLIPAKYPLQLLTGIGISNGTDPTIGEADDRFTSINVPLIARALYRFKIGDAYLATGVELSMEFNNKNNVIGLMLPIQWGRK